VALAPARPAHDPAPLRRLARPNISPAVDDRELLARIRGGDRDAFDTIFRAYYAPLVGSAQALLRERAVAEEVVQDVMLELWRRREALAVDDSLRAYLFRSARNRALNHLRHGRVERRAEPGAAAEVATPPTAFSRLAEAEIDVALRQALDSLPAPTREVFELSRVHGLRYAEIARVLDVSVKTVEARMGKALRALRERLAPWLPGDGRT
jgi:RNA polymerase sigma-19 factor, ECF subfamily